MLTRLTFHGHPRWPTGGLSLLFTHVRPVLKPVKHVLGGGLLSFHLGEKVLSIGTGIAGDDPGFHRWACPAIALVSSIPPLPPHKHIGASERSLRSASVS